MPFTVLRFYGFTVLLSFLNLSCPAQFDAGPNDTINPGVPVTLTATYGEIGTGVTIDDDGVEGPFPVGFNFSFFGNVYNQFYIGANGWISFSPNSNSSGIRQAFAVPNLGDRNPKNCILGPFQDLLPKQAGSPYIYYLTTGQSPNRQLTVMWCQTPMYWCELESVTFQIVLLEGTNTIENHIFHKPACPDWYSNLATIGVQNATGFIGYAAPGRNATSWTTDEESWRYVPTSIDSFQIISIPYDLQPIVPGNKVSYRWYQGSEQIGNTQSITVTPTVTTLYHAIIRLCDGEEFTDSVTVAVIPYIPNAFTPNGDGLNDRFYIYGIQPENIIRFNFQIYDRWGQMIFSTNDILEGWDGTFKEGKSPPGAYAWVVFYEDNKKIRVTKKGTVMLVR